MLARLTRFWRDTSAATSIEYAIIAGSLSILIVAGAYGIGQSLNTKYYGRVLQGLT